MNTHEDYYRDFLDQGIAPGQLLRIPHDPEKGTDFRIGRAIGVCSVTLVGDDSVEETTCIVTLPTVEHRPADNVWYVIPNAAPETWTKADVLPLEEEVCHKLSQAMYAAGPLQDKNGIDGFIRVQHPRYALG